MPIKPITTVPQPPRYQVTGPGWLAFHDGSKVLEKKAFTNTVDSGRKILAADTEAELDAGIARLELTPLPPTLAQELKAVFDQLPPEAQALFEGVRLAVAKLLEQGKKDAAIVAVEAQEVPESLAPLKAAILAKLRA